MLRSNTAWLGICAATPCPWSNCKTRRKDQDTKTAGSVGCQELENLHRAHRRLVLARFLRESHPEMVRAPVPTIENGGEIRFVFR
jgi:hypothetical protein